MLFGIQHDHGDRIIGYLVPDSFSEPAVFRVLDGDSLLLEMEANEIRDALISAGRHGTGQCGFNVGEELIPNLGQIEHLMVQDAATGILVYRRNHHGTVPRKVLRLETSLFPQWRFDEFFRAKFQYFEKGLERFGRETVTQMLVLGEVESIYLSGRVLFKNFEYFVDQKFDVLCLLQDPYEEFAERILVLSRLGELGANYLGERDAVRFAPAIAFAASAEFDKPDVLKRQLLSMPYECAELFADPVVRQLTASTPADMPTGTAVSTALDILSRCVVTGQRSDPRLFTEAISDLLGVNPGELPAVPQFGRIAPFAKILRETRAIDHLIERDRELYDQFERAQARARSI